MLLLLLMLLLLMVPLMVPLLLMLQQLVVAAVRVWVKSAREQAAGFQVFEQALDFGVAVDARETLGNFVGG
jgi:hypothetical protein